MILKEREKELKLVQFDILSLFCSKIHKILLYKNYSLQFKNIVNMIERKKGIEAFER